MKSKWKCLLMAGMLSAPVSLVDGAPIERFRERSVPKIIPGSSKVYEIVERVYSAKSFVFFRNFNPTQYWGKGYRQTPVEEAFNAMAQKGLNMAFLLDGNESMNDFVSWAHQYPNVKVRWNTSRVNHGFIDGPANYILFDGDVLNLRNLTYLSVDEWKDYLEDFTNSWTLSDPSRRRL